jgi:hypothetical protein
MSSSLVLGTVGELLPADPKAPGAHLLLQYDLGDPQTVTAAVQALLLDGERVHRTHVGNRTFTLPILVIGADRDDLTARVDALLDDVDSDTYTLTWTPDAGLPLVFDCFPAQATVRWDVMLEEDFVQQVDLTIPALPYGRSPVSVTPSLTLASTVQLGKLFTLHGLIGSARSPIGAAMGFAAATDAWLIHRPPVDADPTAPIIGDLTGGPVTLANAQRLRGTYSLVLGMQSYGAPGQARTVTVTVTQSGTTVSQQLIKAYTSSLNLRHLVVGNITLPLVDRPAGATSSITITVADSGSSTFLTVMLLDTRGQTVQALSQAAGTGAGALEAWIDAPDVGDAIGPMWSSNTATTRASAYAVTEPRVSGGPLALSAADEGGALLVYGASSLPATPVLGYYPRWLAERVA